MKINVTRYILVFVVNIFSNITKDIYLREKELEQMLSRNLIEFPLIWYIMCISVINLTCYNHIFNRIR